MNLSCALQYLKNILLIFMVSSTCRNGEAKLAYTQLMKLSRFPQVKKEKHYFYESEFSLAHILYKSEGSILKRAGICEIQCFVQNIKNRIPISGPIASPFSTCVPFWGKSGHVGQVNIFTYFAFLTETPKEKIFYMN